MKIARLLALCATTLAIATIQPGCATTQGGGGIAQPSPRATYEFAVRLARIAHATEKIDDETWETRYLPAIAAGEALVTQIEAAQDGGDFDAVAVLNAALDEIIAQLKAKRDDDE